MGVCDKSEEKRSFHVKKEKQHSLGLKTVTKQKVFFFWWGGLEEVMK